MGDNKCFAGKKSGYSRGLISECFYFLVMENLKAVSKSKISLFHLKPSQGSAIFLYSYNDAEVTFLCLCLSVSLDYYSQNLRESLTPESAKSNPCHGMGQSRHIDKERGRENAVNSNYQLC